MPCSDETIHAILSKMSLHLTSMALFRSLKQWTSNVILHKGSWKSLLHQQYCHFSPIIIQY